MAALRHLRRRSQPFPLGPCFSVSSPQIEMRSPFAANPNQSCQVSQGTLLTQRADFKSPLMASVRHSATRPDRIVPGGAACKLNADGESLVPDLEQEVVSHGSISPRQALLCQLHCGAAKWLTFMICVTPADRCYGVQNVSCGAEEKTRLATTSRAEEAWGYEACLIVNAAELRALDPDLVNSAIAETDCGPGIARKHDCRDQCCERRN